jgi:hypothetical protein
MKRYFTGLLVFYFYISSSLAQISQGGIPLSFKYSSSNRNIETVLLKAPDLDALRAEDISLDKSGAPPRVAIDIPVGKSIQNSGTWEVMANGDMVWKMKIIAPGALAISTSFSRFHLPAGSRLFIYNTSRTQILGAYTSYNNKEDEIFSTELLMGDTIIIEYDKAEGSIEPVELEIGSVGYAYRMVYPDDDENTRAGACEVNINCPEGANWQDQKRGVARIYLKNGTAYYWCTGSLVNNTNLDRKPYFLTANHCAPNPSAQDLAQWIFYFNYEAPDCSPPTVDPPSNTMN